MYEPSRLISSFHIAGFKYWDGACVLSDLRAGEGLQLVPEPDNPYDSQAVAIYRGSDKLGFVPAELNGTLSLLLHYGHAAAFEARVQQVSPESNPWEQVRVGVYVVDAR